MNQSAGPDTERPLRIGVIGAGVMGSNHARVFSGLAGGKLIGIAASRQDDQAQ